MSENEKSNEGEPGEPPKISRAWALAFILGGLGVFSVIASAIWAVGEKADCTKCHGSLKQMGLTMLAYHSDGTSNKLPVLRKIEVSAANDGGYFFDANMLSCDAARQDMSRHYVWNPKFSGGNWPDWNNPNSPLIWDATPHKFNGKLNVVFGDAHVEAMTAERLQELTR